MVWKEPELYIYEIYTHRFRCEMEWELKADCKQLVRTAILCSNPIWNTFPEALSPEQFLNEAIGNFIVAVWPENGVAGKQKSGDKRWSASGAEGRVNNSQLQARTIILEFIFQKLFRELCETVELHSWRTSKWQAGVQIATFVLLRAQFQRQVRNYSALASIFHTPTEHALNLINVI